MTDLATAPVTAPDAAPAAPETVSQQPASEPVAPEPAAVPDWKARREAMRDEPMPEVVGKAPKTKAEPPPAAPEPAVEQPAEQPPPEPPPDPRDAALAELAQKEARIRAMHGRWKAEQAAAKPHMEFATKLQGLVKSDPLAAMRELASAAGVEFHDLYSRATHALVAEVEPPDPGKVAEAAAKKAFDEQMRAAREAWEAQQREQQQQTIRQQFDASVREIGSELASGNWPLLSLRDSALVAKSAIDIAAREYAASGKVLDYSVCLDRLESGLQAQAEKDYQAALLKKQGQGAQKPEAPPDTRASQVDAPTGQQVATGRPRTIAQHQATEAGPPKSLTWQERRERLRRRLEGE